MRKLDVEQFIDLIDGQPPVHPVRALIDGLDLGLLAVVFVGDLSDQLLQKILDGDQSGHRSVLVQDDGDVDPPRLHVP